MLWFDPLWVLDYFNLHKTYTKLHRLKLDDGRMVRPRHILRNL
jgi:hypothetical protein